MSGICCRCEIRHVMCIAFAYERGSDVMCVNIPERLLIEIRCPSPLPHLQLSLPVNSVCFLPKSPLHVEIMSIDVIVLLTKVTNNNTQHVQRNDPLRCSKAGALPPSCTRRPSLPELRHSCPSIAASHRSNPRCNSAAPHRNGRAPPPSIAALGE